MALPVLIVEDHPDLAHLLELIVESAGYQPVAVSVADEARARLSGRSFAATIVEDLPDGSGRAFIAELKVAWPSCVVILLANGLPGRSEGPERRRLAREGPQPDVVLTKPFEPEELAAVLRVHVPAPHRATG